MKLITVILLMVFSSGAFAGEPADINTLSKSGYIMGPDNSRYPVHKSWQDYRKLMGSLKIYDQVVERMVDIFCSEDQNKSVLIVGEPSDSYRYIFARMAVMAKPEGCAQDLHVEVDINKIEAGHKYVGEVEEYWQKSILSPVDGKNAILYFRSLFSVIGIGSHSNDASGIETELSANVLSGRMKAVAFVNKYEYERIRSSEHAYVLTSFAEKINLEPIEEDNVKKMVSAYLKTLFPNVSMSKEERKYLIKTLAHYQPNVNEPERTVNVLKSLLRKVGGGAITKTDVVLEEAIETPHKYEPNSNLEFTIDQPEADRLAVVFDFFETESGTDKLSIYDENNSSRLLAEYSGNKDAFTSPVFKTNRLKLVFRSDGSDERDGFKITKLKAESVETYNVKRKDVRNAIFSFVQVPSWIVDRKFKRIAELAEELNADVVGAEDGKAAVVREAKIGYVIGRTTKKPIANLLLAGPTGTGKSHLAKSTADALDMRIITLDMTSYQTGPSFERFVETMSRNLTLYPFAVYLFEEIDKANPAILDQLFFLMDDGLFYDKFQRPLSARGAFIVMTTNAGHEVILENPDHPELDRLANEALQKVFRLSFLNRFNDVLISKPFTLDQYRRMSKALYRKKSKKIKLRFGWNLEMDEASLELIAVKGQSRIYGSRPIERLMENILVGAMAEYHLQKGEIPNDANIVLSKLAGDNAMFKVQVNENSIEFEADLRNNNGLGFQDGSDKKSDNAFLKALNRFAVIKDEEL